MNALAEALVRLLRGHHLVHGVRVINYDETPSGKLELKLRCRLARAYQFQLWLHHEQSFQDYAYQLCTDHPILRWDNAPHYPHVSTAPHHFHDDRGLVVASPLRGDPLPDLTHVLAQIEQWLSTPETGHPLN